MNTGLNPEFLITNAFRDIQVGLINLNQVDKGGLIKSTPLDYPRRPRRPGAVSGKKRRAESIFRDYAAAGGSVNFS